MFELENQIEDTSEKLFKSAEAVENFSTLPGNHRLYYKLVGNLISSAKESVKEIKKLREENEKLKITTTALFDSAEKSS